MSHVISYKDENDVTVEYTIAASTSYEDAINRFMIYANKNLPHLNLSPSEICVRDYK